MTAKYPSPFSRKLCAGKTERLVDSSGAPKNVEGIKSMKVCVIAIAMIIMQRLIGEIILRMYVDSPKIAIEIRLIWIPGVSPVIVPKIIPITMQMIISKINF